MPRDYRRKSQSRNYARKPQTSSGGKSIITGVVIGLVVAVACWYYAPTMTEKFAEMKSHRTSGSHDHLANKKEKIHPKDAVAAKPKSSAPEFDFYTVLQKNQVDPNTVANSVAKKPASAPVATAPAAPNAITTSTTTPVVQNPALMLSAEPATLPAAANTAPPPVKPHAPVESAQAAQRFTLQVASLKSFDDADRLKAQLTMLGFDVAIQKSTVNNQILHRVFAGSYASKNAALKQQAVLKENGISSILIKQ